MSIPADQQRVAWLQRFSLAASGLTIATGAGVLIGWTFDIEPLKSVFTGLKAMNPLSAVAFVLVGLALGLFHRESSRLHHRRWVQCFAGIAILIGLSVLCGRFLSPGLSFDQILFRAKLGDNLMAWNTAASFVLLGAALVLSGIENYRWRRLGQLASVALVIVTVPVIVGYAFNASPFGAGTIVIPMALNSAILLCLLGLGTFFAQTESPLVRMVTGDTLGGSTVRRLIPAAIAIPFLLDWLRLVAERYGWVEPAFGAALVSVSTMLLFAALIAWNGRMLHRMEVSNTRADQALRTSEELSRTIINTAYDAFIAIDAGGRVVDWNRQAEGMFGWSRSQVFGQPLVDYIVPTRYRDAHTQGLQKFLETGEGPVLNRRVEIFAMHRGGREFPVELAIAPIRVGETWLFSAFVHDNTLRKQAENEWREAKEAAEAASRAKSDFLANMSHEIRTPLNGVIGMTELALDGELNPEQREYLTMAKTSADHLLAVINDILDFSKIEAGRLELESINFDLRSLLDDTIGTLALRAHQKGLELACHVLPDVPEHLVGDPGRLRQVIVNLVGNAIKFTERGEVVVHVERELPTTDEARLRFSVQDTGIGIPDDRQNALFKAFSQVDASTTRRYGGTGLGLAISSSIVRMMGGRIWLDSKLGSGSTFCFTAHFGVGEQPAAPSWPAEVRRLQDMTVLVVDDNANNRMILVEMLAGWRMQPTTVECGRDALTALEDAWHAGRPFDLVLLDNMMPEMNGFELAARIKQNLALVGATLMMLSSADRRGDATRCNELGLAAYLIKPIKQSELFNSIVNVLGLSRDNARRPSGTRLSIDKCPRPLRLLLAEDNPVNQTFAVRLLEKRGHRVVVCGDGKQAVAAWEREPFDVLLLDVQMPEMDGFEATGVIRAREQINGGHVPIVAMTAHAMKGDREHCLEAGMDDYVSKPLQARELFAVVERLAGAESSVPAESAAETDDGKPIFDEAAALKNVDGDRELLTELIQIFARQWPQWNEEIRGSIAARDLTRLHRVAHTVKGAATNLGFATVGDRAQRLEILDAVADWDVVNAMSVGIEQAADRALAAAHVPAIV